jgi:hypothetical protein
MQDPDVIDDRDIAKRLAGGLGGKCGVCIQLLCRCWPA